MRFGDMLTFVVVQGTLLVLFFGNPFGNPLSSLRLEDHVTINKHYERQWGTCQAELAQAEHDRDLLKDASRSTSWLEQIGLGVVMGAALFGAFAGLNKIIFGRWTNFPEKKRP